MTLTKELQAISKELTKLVKQTEKLAAELGKAQKPAAKSVKTKTKATLRCVCRCILFAKSLLASELRARPVEALACWEMSLDRVLDKIKVNKGKRALFVEWICWGNE